MEEMAEASCEPVLAFTAEVLELIAEDKETEAETMSLFVLELMEFVAVVTSDCRASDVPLPGMRAEVSARPPERVYDQTAAPMSEAILAMLSRVLPVYVQMSFGKDIAREVEATLIAEASEEEAEFTMAFVFALTAPVTLDTMDDEAAAIAEFVLALTEATIEVEAARTLESIFALIDATIEDEAAEILEARDEEASAIAALVFTFTAAAIEDVAELFHTAFEMSVVEALVYPTMNVLLMLAKSPPRALPHVIVVG